ncbi:MAG: 4-hydroxy-3-methylbut-2-enyl diphosphate reductase, partial [Alistipes sp.]|nr:4-hydroxy-3-methylbut-2-enyl diphosphate reductase [Alistipes sp.]
SRPVYFLSQTTQSIALFESLGRRMKELAADPEAVRIDDTICRQVSNREQHLRSFAERFDVVVFVCGRKSSNGRVLFEVCREANPRTYNIEEAAELRSEWFDGAASVGICGATSTPKWLMQSVADAVAVL